MYTISKRESYKLKLIPKISKNNRLKKEKTEITVFKGLKKTIQDSKDNLKLKNKNINISSKKDNKQTTTTNTNIKINNLTDSSEILIDKKRSLNAEISNKKINLKTKYNKNSEEKDKTLYSNNKDYNLNPFLTNNKSNNNKNQEKAMNKDKDKDKLKDNDKDKGNNYREKEENKKINNEKKNINSDIIKTNDNNKRKTYIKECLNTMDFSFENKILNTIEIKDKNNIYKNRFLSKINKNNSKERKSEGSFGSIINQKKMKLFSFINENNNNYSLNCNFRESVIASISSKNIILEPNIKRNLLSNIKDDFKKVPKKKIQVSSRKLNSTEKKLYNRKSNNINNNLNKNIIENKSLNNNINYNKENKESKEIIKLEAKINKNREILFNSKGKNIKWKNKEQNFQLIFPKEKKYNKDTKNNKENTLNKKSIQRNTNNKTFNLKNNNKLYNSNSTLSKNKLQEKENKNEIKNIDNNKEKTVHFKNASPTKNNIDIKISKPNNNNDYFIDKQYLLSSERFSSLNKELSFFSLSKDNTNNNKKVDNLNLYSIENLFLSNKFYNINKSPQLYRKKDNNKIIRTKTEINDKNKNKNQINNENNIKQDNNNKNLNYEINKSKEINKDKNKTIKNPKLVNNENIIRSLNTLDNESFKRSTVKKLIKNNQYKALLTEMATNNYSKNNQKEKLKENENEKEEVKESEFIKNKKKYKFSERRRGSHTNEPIRKLTESSENYYDLYKKAFNDKVIEQKFSFKPKTKNINYINKNKDNEFDRNIFLNKKVSTISFNNQQKQTLDNDINIDEAPFHKNVLSNSLDENKLYDKDEESGIDNNKNFILDLNHFIPIDENKFKNTISKPLFENNKLK